MSWGAVPLIPGTAWRAIWRAGNRQTDRSRHPACARPGGRMNRRPTKRPR